jgi:hypothetical protein
MRDWILFRLMPALLIAGLLLAMFPPTSRPILQFMAEHLLHR